MSIHLGNSASDYGTKTAGVINHNAAYTWMAWLERLTDSDNYGFIWAGMGTSGESEAEADELEFASDGTSLCFVCFVGGTPTEITGGQIALNTPTHVALVRESATSLKAYIGATQTGNTIVTNVASRAATQREQLGPFSTYSASIKLTGIKQWQAALTPAEIAAEMKAIRPLRLANLHSWHPAIADTQAGVLKDYSGNGRDWVAQGSPSADPKTPPVSWGASVVNVGLPTVTAQFSRPTSDVSAGTWTSSSGSDLYAMLDETAASDADYIVTTGASTCEVALGTLSDPASSTGHVVRYRISATGGGIIVRLRQETTTIATWTHDPAPSSLTTYAQTLSAGEADSITNYGSLSLQFEAV